MGIAETAIGVLVGALVTVLASRYYFRRSISKRLSVYQLLDSFVFDGITPDVRKELQFRFHDRNVNELQQMLFLVANDGERAIRDVIESLTLEIPHEVEILDASIVHREPDGLKADIVVELHPPGATNLKLDFPLLNKGEFFVVKLLLSGRFKLSSLSMLCDDLPRTIKVEPLPPDAVRDTEYKFEWTPAFVGLCFLWCATWACYSAYLVHGVRPDLFHPFVLVTPKTAQVWVWAFLYTLSGSVFLLTFGVGGFILLGLAIFGGDFPPSRRPRFRLSKELQRMVFPYHVLRLPRDVEAPSHDKKPGAR